MLELRESNAVRDTGTRYPDEIKELAYQLWAFVTDRNASEVSRQLKTEDYGSVEVPRETVAYWAREYAWADRLSTEMNAIAPDLRYQAFSALLFGGLEGARYIRRVAAGHEDEPNTDDIPKSDDPEVNYDRLMARVRSHDAARKARLTASIAAVDRIGFSPVGKGIPGVDTPNGEIDQPDFANMTIDQLRQYELGKRRKRTA